MIVSGHHRAILDAFRLIGEAGAEQIDAFANALGKNRLLLQETAWRGSRIPLEELAELTTEELDQIATSAFLKTYVDQRTGARIRRICIASLNAVLKGRPLTAPLGPGKFR
ncbi:hypothetical protein NF700_17485 [Sphingomonadaceae bacterium OTU29MARTA1]|nr:hypothetical protein NF700_17485 [Sphingomonadaceae bacterium OTU29MARTA1]